jgi:hypothetical protein
MARPKSLDGMVDSVSQMLSAHFLREGNFGLHVTLVEMHGCCGVPHSCVWPVKGKAKYLLSFNTVIIYSWLASART